MTERQSREFYLCPNAHPNDGSLTRAGYALLGYNTAADGSGDFYACGWNVVMPGNGEIDLYAVWAAETPEKYFKYSIQGGTATVTACTSRDATVVIPAMLGGKKVTAIASDALRGLPLTTLVLPPKLATIERSAVADCASLKRALVAQVTTVYAAPRAQIAPITDVDLVAEVTALAQRAAGADNAAVAHAGKAAQLAAAPYAAARPYAAVLA